MSDPAVQSEPILVPMYLQKPGREHAPRPRNREIFEAVCVQGMTERAAAVQFKLSKTRIHQICEAVTNWVARTGGGPTRTWSERQRLSEFMHRERLEDLYRFARNAWTDSESVRTSRVYVEEGKPDRKVLAAKVSPGESPYLRLALQVEKVRAKFEDDRPKPPSADEMTVAERLREVEELLQEALRWKERQAKEMTNDQVPLTHVKSDYDPAPMYGFVTEDDQAAVEEVNHLSAAEVIGEQDDEVASPAMTDRERPVTNHQLSADGAAASDSAVSGRGRTPPRRRRRDPLEGVDLSQYAPPPLQPSFPPAREWPHTPDGLPPPMILIEFPTKEELEQYWALEEGQYVFVRPTVLGKRCPDSGMYQRWTLGQPKDRPPKKKGA